MGNNTELITNEIKGVITLTTAEKVTQLKQLANDVRALKAELDKLWSERKVKYEAYLKDLALHKRNENNYGYWCDYGDSYESKYLAYMAKKIELADLADKVVGGTMYVFDSVQSETVSVQGDFIMWRK
jgi:hypothetical protein